MNIKASHILIGKQGEREGIEYLEQSGYQILEKNYRTRAGEIDCIAKHKDILVFIEIKTRRSRQFGLPQEAVSIAKQRKIIKSAKIYLQHKSYNQNLSIPIRFDVLAITLREANRPTFELIQNAIELE